MVRLLRAARRRELTLVITSSLKDAAELIVAEEALFVAKVGKVVVQGGCEDFVAGVSVSGPRAYLKPDTAHNNMFDLEAATVVYAACQRLGVPLVVTSRFSAYSCPVSARRRRPSARARPRALPRARPRIHARGLNPRPRRRGHVRRPPRATLDTPPGLRTPGAALDLR